MQTTKLSPTTQNMTISNPKIATLVNSEYNELDDSSHTPPLSPGKLVSEECTKEEKVISKTISLVEIKQKLKSNKTNTDAKVLDCIQPSDEEIVLIESSPDENKHQIIDYDDENDKSFVGAEVSLCAAAGDSDQGDLSVLETFQPEISDVASPQVLDPQEYVLFSSDAVDYAGDSDCEQLSFIQKDSVVISYSRQTSESNGESNAQSPNEDEDDNNSIHVDEIGNKSSNSIIQTDKTLNQLEDEPIHESVDSEIVVISSNVGSPEEHIATEEDFEELIDNGKPEENMEEETNKEIPEKVAVVTTSEPPISAITRTETTKKTVAVISLATNSSQSGSGVHQFKIVNTGKNTTGITRLPVISATVLSPHPNTKILNEVSQATVASVSIANQTISVPVLKSLNVPMVPLTSTSQGSLSPISHIKKVPITISAPSLNIPMSKPISSVISVISSNINVSRVATLSPVIALTTTNSGSSPRMPIPILTQQQFKQKLVKAFEKPTLTISGSKLSSLTVSQDITLPAKIFQDEPASPDSSHNNDDNKDFESNLDLMNRKRSPTIDKINSPGVKFLHTNLSMHNATVSNQNTVNTMQPHAILLSNISTKPKDVDIENEITKHTELPMKPMHSIKIDLPNSPQKVSEQIPDNIMEGDDEKTKTNDEISDMTNTNSQINRPPLDKKDSNVDKPKTDIQIKSVFESNLNTSSEIDQDSVQISIPSPTTTQDQRYIENFTLQAHNSDVNNTVNFSHKQVECIKEMFDMLNNISGESKSFNFKSTDQSTSALQETATSANTNKDDAISDIDEIILQDLGKPAAKNVDSPQETLKSTIPVHVIMRSRESSQSPISVGTSRLTTVMPQLSPLYKPTELTTNIANVSQQLRTIMSSINTSKVESTVNSTVNLMRKNHMQGDLGTSTQVNFENLLPSTKVEITTGKSSNRGLIEKAVLNSVSSSVEISQSVVGTTVMSKSTPITTNIGIIRAQQSPIGTPSNSPRNSPLLSVKSPVQSPLITNQSNDDVSNPITQTIVSQNLQMPSLSKFSTSSSQIISSVIQSSLPNVTSSSMLQKNQIMSNILSTTLLQPSRNVSNNSQLAQNMGVSQPPALVLSSRPSNILSSNQIPASVQSSNNSNVLSGGFAQSANKTLPSSNIISLKLLRSQLTSPLKRSKSTDEPKTDIGTVQTQPNKRHSLESVIVKSEPVDSDDVSGLQTAENTGCKFSSLNPPQKTDESQNVLLKQLLQNSGGNSPTVTPVSSRASVSSLLGSQRTAPSLGIVPSLEAQLARPSIPPPHLPAVTSVEPPKLSPKQVSLLRDSPFISKAAQSSIIPTVVTSMPITTQSTTQSLMDVRKPISKLMMKEELPLTPSPVTVPASLSFSTSSNDILSQTIKKEVMLPQQSPVNQPFIHQEIKKELLDETSQQSAISGVSAASDQCKLDLPLKEELSDTALGSDSLMDANTQESIIEARKRKRREYQQKRRQMQNNQKIEANNNKKRPRKGYRLEEDYDTFIDNLMIQLRQLPAMQIQEPLLGKNYGVCPIFGSGDLSKVGVSKDYNHLGDLTGDFGSAEIPNIADFYNTKPFGENEPIPEKPPVSTQRGFYDQEFSPIRLDNDLDDKKMEFICKERDTETPDTIMSSSSPECCLRECSNQFPGLRLIDESDSEDEVERSKSPIISIITPIPIRVKPSSIHFNMKDGDKENVRNNFNKDTVCVKSKVLSTGIGSENDENVTVTLTLTSSAAEDILRVLRELAGILHIPPPTTYQIVERTTTPPSHKLGLYRSKGRDGKEGAPIDIQSILNGEAKFCRHCDVVILDNVIRAKPSEFPLLSSSSDLLSDGENDLYFCSTQCYKRFAWTPTNILADNKVDTKLESDDIIPNVDIKDKDEFENASAESMDGEEVDVKPTIKNEKMDLTLIESLDNDDLMKNDNELTLKISSDNEIKMEINEEDVIKREFPDEESGPPSKIFRGCQYKYWSPGCIQPTSRYKKPTEREITEMVFRTGVAVMPLRLPEDVRRCSLCHAQGDGVADGPARLLNYDVDKWVHLNCALWSDGVYETVNGALMNFENSLQSCNISACAFCERTGATVRCFKTRCSNIYHLSCAVKDKCVFHKNKTAHCSSHHPKGEKENELTTLSVQRRVYVQRDESRQVAAVMQLADPTYLLRVGSLIFLSVGQLLPHQLPNFHTPHFIYPVGYQIVSFFLESKYIYIRIVI